MEKTINTDHSSKLSKAALVGIGQRLRRDDFPASNHTTVPGHFMEQLRKLDRSDDEFPGPLEDWRCVRLKRSASETRGWADYAPVRHATRMIFAA